MAQATVKQTADRIDHLQGMTAWGWKPPSNKDKANDFGTKSQAPKSHPQNYLVNLFTSMSRYVKKNC